VRRLQLQRPERLVVDTVADERTQMVDLAGVLAYENKDVIDRYVVDNDADPEEAAVLFEDVKRWLWLCAEAKRETALGLDGVPEPTIFDEQLELDELWHTFILFTPAYVEFCFRFFGSYLHHAPTPEREKRDFETASPRQQHQARRTKAERKRVMAGYVFDKLGEEVARRWYLPEPARAIAPVSNVESVGDRV
jgi:hypothetical protein